VRLLAIDTATALCGVAVLEVELDDAPTRSAPTCSQVRREVRHAVRRERVTTHSERLLPLIGECLFELGLVPAQLDAVVCSAGPGSFTGLRIGVATAKGLCFALERPLLMISSLEVLAEGEQRPALAVLDAGRGQVYARLFVEEGALPAALRERHPELLSDALWSPAELVDALARLGSSGPLAGPLTLCGPDALRHPELGRLEARPEASAEVTRPLVLARLGLARLLSGDRLSLMAPASLDAAVPNYICPSAAETKAAAATARQSA
jgi:tRNA threonylcarbamoyl adenosine modification protein YeaZ